MCQFEDVLSVSLHYFAFIEHHVFDRVLGSCLQNVQ